MELNSREFFLDGIKRDRYVWSGDAYQSYLLNYYLYFDNDICKRTTLALRGKDPMVRHINKIMDYSFYWVLGIRDYYLYTADRAFVERIYPKLESLLEFCIHRTDENGLMAPQPDDWIFVDWSPYLDKEGPICVEQILFVKALETAVELGKLLGKNTDCYTERISALYEKIHQLYWCEEKGAYIDSYTSGKKNVSRHTNIFALRFGIADERESALIRRNVLKNDAVPNITTPYFKFYELESLCACSDLETVTRRMLDYWGGMLQLGATSFWEEYDPLKSGREHFEMYEKPFAKSLCHAWGASPIYLLQRFYLGVVPTAPGYSSFVVEPKVGGLGAIRGKVPTPHGMIRVTTDEHHAEVLSDLAGGVLRFGGKELPIQANVSVRIDI